ncbi:Putative 115 kDa protein in type-1 retrotransposable element R1DM [Anthophora retusa]
MPGPDGIPNEILKKLIEEKPKRIGNILNRCLEERCFPDAWKRCSVSLIPKDEEKEGKIGEKSKFRPICLINTMGKVLEKVIERRLQEEVKDKINIGQFGFSKGMETIDAVRKVTEIIQERMKKGMYVIAVSLDIKNAFNSVGWDQIIKNMEGMGINEALRDIIGSYLSNRKAEMMFEGDRLEWEVNRGVPQGSVLGPTLWNIGYNNILKNDECGGRILCYADDTIFLDEGKHLGKLMTNAQRRNREIVDNIEELGLDVAPEKTELVIFSRKRYKFGEKREINTKNRIIKAGKSMKYLGITLDEKLSFRPHIQGTYGKSIKVMNSLGMVLGNIRGSTEGKRKLLTRVGQAIFMYGAPIWEDKIGKGDNKKWAGKISRISAIKTSAAYRTVTTEAAEVIAGSPPVELIAKMRKNNYERIKELNLDGLNKKERNRITRRIKKEGNRKMMKWWQEKWEIDTEKATSTKKLITNIEMWKNRKYGSVDYYLTQFLSGHGAFNQYLYKFKKRESPLCRVCKKEENAEHVIMHCKRWENERRGIYREDSGQVINSRKLVEQAIRNKEKWRLMTETVKRILSTKETEERGMGF